MFMRIEEDFIIMLDEKAVLLEGWEILKWIFICVGLQHYFTSKTRGIFPELTDCAYLRYVLIVCPFLSLHTVKIWYC